MHSFEGEWIFLMATSSAGRRAQQYEKMPAGEDGQETEKEVNIFRFSRKLQAACISGDLGDGYAHMRHYGMGYCEKRDP